MAWLMPLAYARAANGVSDCGDSLWKALPVVIWVLLGVTLYTSGDLWRTLRVSPDAPAELNALKPV